MGKNGTNYLRGLVLNLSARKSGLYTQLHSCLITIPEKYLTSDEKIIIQAFMILSVAIQVNPVPEYNLTSEEIGKLTGMSASKVRRLLLKLPDRIKFINKKNILFPGIVIEFYYHPRKGFHSVYVFKYITEMGVSNTTEKKRYSEDDDLKHDIPEDEIILRTAALKRLASAGIPFESVKDYSFSPLHSTKKINAAVEYTLHQYRKKLKTNPDMEMEPNYFKKALDNPEWYKGLLFESEKIKNYADHISAIGTETAAIVLHNKFITPLTFGHINKHDETIKIGLDNFYNLAEFKHSFQKHFDDMPREMKDDINNLLKEVMPHIRNRGIFRSSNTEMIRKDLFNSLVQAATHFINFN